MAGSASAYLDSLTGHTEAERGGIAEYRRLLEVFISKELQPWTKQFPDEYYQQLYRLLDYPSTKGRPQCLAQITNRYIYGYLPPGVLVELQALNPLDEKGRRKQRLHQWLTPEVALRVLQQHLSNVITLMRSSQTWGAFKRAFARAYPKPGDQMDLARLDDAAS